MYFLGLPVNAPIGVCGPIYYLVVWKDLIHCRCAVTSYIAIAIGPGVNTIVFSLAPTKKVQATAYTVHCWEIRYTTANSPYRKYANST